MFISAKQLIDNIGMNVLLQFVSGKSFDTTQRPTKDDIEQALLVSPDTELQLQIHAWYEAANKNVSALITGYVGRYSVSQEQIKDSVLSGIAADLMRFELCVNPNDEHIAKRRDTAIKMLDKIEKGVIQLADNKPVSRAAISTRRAPSEFNWEGY